MRKSFEGVGYEGRVVEFLADDERPLWHVKYDDGDEEDYDAEEVEVHAAQHRYYQENGEDPPPVRGVLRQGGRALRTRPGQRCRRPPAIAAC